MMQFIFTYLAFFCCSFLSADSESIIPGRLGSSQICMAEFGNMKLFFYMTQDKYDLARSVIHDVNENMALSTNSGELNFPTHEITPAATKYREPLGFDEYDNPIYADLAGKLILDKHAERVRSIAEKCLGITIQGGFSRNVSLIMNFDSNKYHQDQFIEQYDFLKNHPLPIPEYYLVQDVTLIDWSMAQGTISGTIIQDEHSEDRFILTLYPKEVACNFYVEPAIYSGPQNPPQYPGAATLVPNSPFAPIDMDGIHSPGSAKGKRMSVVVRGLTLKEEIDSLQQRSKILPVNRYRRNSDEGQQGDKVYPNGLVIKSMAKIPLEVNRNRGILLADMSNTEVFQTDFSANLPAIQAIMHLFNIDCSPEQVTVKHLIKRDGGFSKLSKEALEIPKGSTIILLNNSKIPGNYRYYNLAQNWCLEGKPWIQLYEFPRHTALQIPYERFNDLSLTPIEEILFRDAKEDIRCKDPNIFNEKIVTVMDLFIFPRLGNNTDIGKNAGLGESGVEDVFIIHKGEG